MAPKRKRSNTFKRYCCAFGCLNKRKNAEQGLTFFAIPQEIERRREWLKAIDREDLLDKNINKAKNYFICCAHFDDSSMIIITKRLKSDAVPTKVLPRRTERDPLQIEPDPPGEIAKVSTYSHAQIQTDDPHKHTLPGDTGIECDIAKPTEDKSLKKFKNESTVQSEPTTTSTAQTQTLISTSTQTELYETSNKMTQTTLELSDESSKRKTDKDIEIVKCKRKKL